MGDLFTHIFDGIAEKYQHELMLISQQFPFEPIKYLRPSLRISFQEGIQMLNDAGIPAPALEVRRTHSAHSARANDASTTVEAKWRAVQGE